MYSPHEQLETYPQNGAGESSGMGESSDADPGSPQRHYGSLFNTLMQECKYSPPGARLSVKLRTALEKMSPKCRRGVCERTRDGCGPLFTVSRRGNVEIIEYLIHVCAVNIEQRGLYEVPDEQSVHTVTPLWCAAVSGRVAAVRVLADAGADLNATSDSGSTPVRSACFMSHDDVVRLLVERGADIHRANHNGGTCLINSVQSLSLCRLLLENGADPNARDTQYKTVLHYAIQEHRVETARLLLEYGADPHIKSRSGDDAIRIACLKGATQVLRVLLSRVHYTREQVADAQELLGATLLDEFNDVAAALSAWRRATSLRHATPHYLFKRGWTPHTHDALGEGEEARVALSGLREWITLRELQMLSEDMDALHTQSLLVTSRVLGPHHKDTVYRLMYRGSAYGDAGEYHRCVELWTWALSIRVRRDTVLHSDSCYAACALTRLLVEWESIGVHQYTERVLTLLTTHLPEAAKLLIARPRSRTHADSFDRVIRCAVHLVHVLVRTADTQTRVETTRRVTKRLLATGLRTAHTGDTLLHLAVSRLNVVRSVYFEGDPGTVMMFPSVDVTSQLLECGASVDTLNNSGSTALHVAAIPYNFSNELVEALINHGAHLDQPNKFGDSALELIKLNRNSEICVLRYITLRCLAARALIRTTPHAYTLPRLPHTLVDFLRLHTP